MNALDVPDGTWTGIVAFYSLIHVPRDQIVETFRELKRVLRPEGILLLSFHIGDEVLHLDEWWGHEVSLDFAVVARRCPSRGRWLRASLQRNAVAQCHRLSRTIFFGERLRGMLRYYYRRAA